MYVAPKIVEKVIIALDSSKMDGLHYIPVEFLKNCEPEVY